MMLLPGMTGIKNELMKEGAKKKLQWHFWCDSHEKAVESSQIPTRIDLLRHQTMFTNVKVKITVSLSLRFLVFRLNSSGIWQKSCLCGETVFEKKFHSLKINSLMLIFSFLLLIYHLKLDFRLQSPGMYTNPITFLHKP